MKYLHTQNIMRILSLCALIVLLGCSKDNNPVKPDPSDPNQAPALTQKVTKFIYETMDEIYLWTAFMPSNIDRRYEKDPAAYFQKLLYKTEDRWSVITDDYEAMTEGSGGVETTFGYDLAFGRFNNSDNLFAVVRFVYPDSPAFQAGLTRGSIILLLNGASITEGNYLQLYYNASNILTLGRLEDNTIYEGSTLGIEAKKMQLSPIIVEKVFDIDGQKIGYLHYSNFFSGSETLLDAVFGRFKAAGIQHLIVDIRYNGGGSVATAARLSSLIAPESVLNGNTVLATYRWNAYYQDYWSKNNPSQLRILFETKTQAYNNLNLEKVYMLTGSGSASASEFVMTGLAPYMSVVKVGNTTHGKYTASILFQAEEYVGGSWKVISGAENWGIQPIVFRYANALGVTDFKEGFVPDYAVTDALMEGVKPLGDVEEPLLAKTIELITGHAAPALPATKMGGFAPVESLLSRPDYFKGSLRIDLPNLPRPSFE